MSPQGEPLVVFRLSNASPEAALGATPGLVASERMIEGVRQRRSLSRIWFGKKLNIQPVNTVGKVQASHLYLILVMSRDGERAAVSEGALRLSTRHQVHQPPGLRMTVWGNKVQKEEKQNKTGGKRI